MREEIAGPEGWRRRRERALANRGGGPEGRRRGVTAKGEEYVRKRMELYARRERRLRERIRVLEGEGEEGDVEMGEDGGLIFFYFFYYFKF